MGLVLVTPSSLATLPMQMEYALKRESWGTALTILSQISTACEQSPNCSSNSAQEKQKIMQCSVGTSLKSLQNMDRALSTPAGVAECLATNLVVQASQISQRAGHLKFETANQNTLKVSQKQRLSHRNCAYLSIMRGVRLRCYLHLSKAVFTWLKLPRFISRSIYSCHSEGWIRMASSIFRACSSPSCFLRNRTCFTTLSASSQYLSSISIYAHLLQMAKLSSVVRNKTWEEACRISWHLLSSPASCSIREYSNHTSESLPYADSGSMAYSARSTVAIACYRLPAFLWRVMRASQDCTSLGFLRILMFRSSCGCRSRRDCNLCRRASISQSTLSSVTTWYSFRIQSLPSAVIISSSNFTYALKMIPKSLALSTLSIAYSNSFLACSNSPFLAQQSPNCTQIRPASSGNSVSAFLMNYGPSTQAISYGYWVTKSQSSKQKALRSLPARLWQPWSSKMAKSILAPSLQSCREMRYSTQVSLKSGFSLMQRGMTCRAVSGRSSRITHALNFCQIFQCCVRGRLRKDQLQTSLARLTMCCFSKAYANINHNRGIRGSFTKAQSNATFRAFHSFDCSERDEQCQTNSVRQECHILQEPGRQAMALPKSSLRYGQGKSLCAQRVFDQLSTSYREVSSPQI